jgi:hypothetical protein
MYLSDMEKEFIGKNQLPGYLAIIYLCVQRKKNTYYTHKINTNIERFLSYRIMVTQFISALPFFLIHPLLLL